MKGLVILSFYQKEKITEQMFATLINQGTIAGIKNANSISSHRYFKLEWQKFFRKISAIGNGFVI